MTMLSRRAAIAMGLGATGALALGLPVTAASNSMPDELRKVLEHAPDAPVLGNPDGDITLTEFFDYNCPFCRTAAADVRKLIASDGKLRVVLREWPVFGEGSVFSTRASLAALKQGKYQPFHTGLLSIDGKADKDSAMAVARKAGLDMDRLRADMEAPEIDEHISLSMALADHMGLMGTPTFIAGNEGAFGRQTLAELQGLVERGRAALA